MCLSSPGGSDGKEPPAVRETQVRSLGQADPLEKRIATHSSVLVWRIPWTEEPGGLQSTGSQSVRHDRATDTRVLTEGLGCTAELTHVLNQLCLN